jgi:anthraniloyl-CoA monooxygenase
MKIVCLGAGPAGLYFSILMKKANPGCSITVIDRNRSDDTFGWGVVFSDKTMDGFRDADPQVADDIERNFHHWDDIDVFFKGEKITSGGHGFSGIARIKLLDILQRRARELGVILVYETEIRDPDHYTEEYDLVIGADGVMSTTRSKYQDIFNPRVDERKCRFIWLGTRRKLDAFTFAFKDTPHGWFNLHAYRFNDDMSTFIVETREETWLAAGIDRMTKDESVRYCEQLFADLLDGEELISNARHLTGAAVWQKFNRVLCERWHHKNIVLIGDAAHTAHFSIGSGTKLAMEDAIALARVLSSTEGDVGTRLQQYQAEREIEALKLQSAARNRMNWFENVERYASLEPEQFAFSLLTGSQRVGHENQKLRDPAYVERLDRWYASSTGINLAPDEAPPPPMFTPFRVRNVTLKNRVMMSPMATYSAVDGLPNAFHQVHYGSRAQGGAALIMTEMTCVSPEGRITPGCTGIWNDEQMAEWKKLVDFVHHHTTAKIALQIGHSGRKGSTRVAWEGIDQPLPSGNWPVVSASPIPYLAGVSQTPREATRADMDEIREQFVSATRRAILAGFDWLEFHAAHGYLVSAFLSPLTNQRTDEYGGTLENRARYPLELFGAIRAVWPQERPMSVRISAHDWTPGGITPDEATEIARLFKEAGADVIDVSSGQVSREEKPVYGRMFQTPFADQIRNEVGIPTIAVGNIFEYDHVNTIIAAGRADLCALARPHLADPAWTLHAAAQQSYAMVEWPKQYIGGKFQLERNLERAAQIALQA